KQGIEAGPSVERVTTMLSEPSRLAQAFRQSGVDVLETPFGGGQGFCRLDGIDHGKVLSPESQAHLEADGAQAHEEPEDRDQRKAARSFHRIVTSSGRRNSGGIESPDIVSVTADG